MRGLKITQKEFLLALCFAIMGFLFSSKEMILFLNTLNPIEGLIVYEIIFYITLSLLSIFGLAVFGFKIKNPLQVFGLLLVWFSFFIVVDWESPYIQYITKGSLEGPSVIYFQSEDGATWYFWYEIMGVKDVGLCRLLTFIISPFILTLVGCYFVTRVEF